MQKYSSNDAIEQTQKKKNYMKKNQYRRTVVFYIATEKVIEEKRLRKN